MGVLSLTNCAPPYFLKIVVLGAHRLSQAENRISDDGKELFHRRTMVGRVFNIIVTKSLPRHEYVIMEAFNVSGSRDSRYGMPTMCANPNCGYQIILPSVSRSFLQLGSMLTATQQDISFIFNAQHDCEGGDCSYTISDTNGQTAAKVERTLTHSTHDKFFINLHALHNAWRLREVLPRNLTEPIPYITNREEFHCKMARKLQKSNPQKRAKAKEKAKDAREQKKRKVEMAEGTEGEQSGDEGQPVA